MYLIRSPPAAVLFSLSTTLNFLSKSSLFFSLFFPESLGPSPNLREDGRFSDAPETPQSDVKIAMLSSRPVVASDFPFLFLPFSSFSSSDPSGVDPLQIKLFVLPRQSIVSSTGFPFSAIRRVFASRKG